MLSDEVRTGAYREALRRLVTPGDVVLDLGSGTGVLAFFACEAGARRVFAVEQEHIADAAGLLARSLGYGDRVEVRHARSTDTTLPEPADVLVTETLGTFALEERILHSVIDARRRLLRPGATIMTFASNTLYVAPIPPDAFLAVPAEVISVDLDTVETPLVRGAGTFVCDRDGRLHGFAGWFAATLAPGVVLSNATAGATHWEQAFLPLEQPVAVRRGVRVAVEREAHDHGHWHWRGTVETPPPVTFDQTTRFGMPPCRLPRHGK